jgi:bifunctional N-acetylglucosamine-1-phosphate-uridyltransferase/glucosamine-1-phosphate-acetyltransferase GlmU-like protein
MGASCAMPPAGQRHRRAQGREPEQLQIRELNTGLMAAPAGRLREWLLGLGSNNSQREYYLTDVVAGAVQAGDRVEAVRPRRRRSHGRQRQDPARAGRGLLPARRAES